MKNLILSASIIMGFAFTNAQVTTPQPSPASTVKQKVGLTDVTVEYSRPSAKERKIFGDVVPIGKLWRTGANSATSIEFSTEATFAGMPVKPGKYALYTIPHDDQWEVFLYTDTKVWGAPTELDKNLIAVHSKVETGKVGAAVESFNIGFDDLTDTSANLTVAWQDTMVKIPITVNPHEAVMESIKKTMSGKPTAGDFGSAATYFLSKNIELKTALEYMSKSVDMAPDAFWNSSTLAEIQAANGDYKGAIKTAEHSLELAKKSEYDAYIQKNEENIKKWSNKK